MGRQFTTAGQGLLKVFYGEVLSVAAVLVEVMARRLMITPMLYLAALVSLAGFALILIGLSGASIAHGGYRTALWCAGVETVITVVFNLGLLLALTNLLSALSTAAGLVSVFWVCRSTAALLMERGEEAMAVSGARTWKVYAGSVAASLVCGLVAGAFYGALAGVLLAAGFLVLRMAAEAFYLVFLFRGQRSLRSKQ